MQLSPVYLYSNKIDVFTNALDSWTGGYRKVYQRNLKIYRGVDNPIDLQLRNGDQKAIEIFADQYVMFNLIGKGTQELILVKQGAGIDDSSASRGRVRFTLSESDLLDLEPGFYQYAIYLETRVAINADEYTVLSKTPLYVDSQFGVIGNIEVSGDVSGRLQSSTEINAFSRYVNLELPHPHEYYISSIVDANPNTSTSASLHTFQFYQTSYAGNVIIQGNTQPGSNPDTWVDIPDTAFENGTNNFNPSSEPYKNIIGKWNWFRIKHTPTAGSIDKVLYR